MGNKTCDGAVVENNVIPADTAEPKPGDRDDRYRYRNAFLARANYFLLHQYPVSDCLTLFTSTAQLNSKKRIEIVGLELTFNLLPVKSLRFISFLFFVQCQIFHSIFHWICAATYTSRRFARGFALQAMATPSSFIQYANGRLHATGSLKFGEKLIFTKCFSF